MSFDRKELETLQTPCFVFDEAELAGNLAAFKDAVERAWAADSVVMGYSVKTAPVAGLIKYANGLGYHAEVVSDEEFRLALDAGVDPAEVVFNGPIKSREWLEYAFAHGAIVNLDSQRELRWTAEYADRHDEAPSVGLRINFDLEDAMPGETMAGDEGVRFGFCHEDGSLGKAIALLRAHGVEPAGLHAHFSTHGYRAETYRVVAEKICALCDEFDLDSIEYIDMGGGYYGGGANKARYDEYAQAMADVLKRRFDPAAVVLAVEPGGSVLCTPCSYVGKVIDAKTVREQTFVVTELSKLNLNSTVFSRRGFAHTLYASDGAETAGSQILCGYTCIEMDRLLEVVDGPALREGDFVSIENAGAYSTSFAPGFFIKNPPSIYMRKAPGCFELLEERRPALPPRD